MKKLFLTLPVVLLVAAACNSNNITSVTPQSQNNPTAIQQNQPSNIKDCGIDTGCFATSFKSCTPSKIYGGTTEVVSGTPESCKVTFASTDDPKYTGGQRLTMECTVNNTNSFKYEEINAAGVYYKGSVCKGSLYDFYVKTLGPLRKQ